MVLKLTHVLCLQDIIYSRYSFVQSFKNLGSVFQAISRWSRVYRIRNNCYITSSESLFFVVLQHNELFSCGCFADPCTSRDCYPSDKWRVLDLVLQVWWLNFIPRRELLIVCIYTIAHLSMLMTARCMRAQSYSGFSYIVAASLRCQLRQHDDRARKHIFFLSSLCIQAVRFNGHGSNC